MISLSKYLYRTEPSTDDDCQAKCPTPELTALASSVAQPALSVRQVLPPAELLAAYQAALAAMGANSRRALPTAGDALDAALGRIRENLAHSPSAESVRQARTNVDQQLAVWADKAQENQKENETAIRDLLSLVVKTAESTGARDEKFSKEIEAVSGRLRAAAAIDNLPTIRRSIAENAGALTTCVARMAAESQEAVRKLTAEVAEYQVRLQAAEARADVDPLTGLCNRRGFEQELELRIATHQQFSLLVADLNGFKAANDRHGHLVGDEILRMFATELKGQFAPEDTVARWGGDEFAAIIPGPAKEGAAREERVRRWALGEYKVKTDQKTISVMVRASLGTVAWNSQESGTDLFARADRQMYQAKQNFYATDNSRNLVRA